MIAEEVAEIDPRLVHFGAEHLKDEDGQLMYVPNEEDPVFRDPVFKTDENGEVVVAPEGVQYDRLVPLLLNLIKRLDQRVQTLEG